jgi:hypothetical protein
VRYLLKVNNEIKKIRIANEKTWEKKNESRESPHAHDSPRFRVSSSLEWSASFHKKAMSCLTLNLGVLELSDDPLTSRTTCHSSFGFKSKLQHGPFSLTRYFK